MPTAPDRAQPGQLGRLNAPRRRVTVGRVGQQVMDLRRPQHGPAVTEEARAPRGVQRHRLLEPRRAGERVRALAGQVVDENAQDEIGRQVTDLRALAKVDDQPRATPAGGGANAAA